ncbi:hypothetical protein ACPV3A_18270 [Paenibacillus sp. Dod16]|uniref:hypothetical protein n=1 Tax=Paenibacillus sp. Dod16 TaxID=3416392 RepID=UPI003CF23155
MLKQKKRREMLDVSFLYRPFMASVLINGQACPTNETAVWRYFHKNDMILLKVVNNILDETRFSFR